MTNTLNIVMLSVIKLFRFLKIINRVHLFYFENIRDRMGEKKLAYKLEVREILEVLKEMNSRLSLVLNTIATLESMMKTLINALIGEEEPLPDELDSIRREEELVPESEIRRRLKS